MKWSIVGLLSLGLLAAVSAFFLVLSLQGTRGGTSNGAVTLPGASDELRQVDILVAARDVEAYSRLGTEDVRVEKLPFDEAEDLLRKGAFRDPLQVVGRVTGVAVRAGDLVVPDMFARRESGLLITTALAQGKRAVSLSLSDSMGIERILYPGCYVDVIASMTVPSGLQGELQPLSMTLLQSAYVLAIGDRSVVSPEGDGDPASTSRSIAGAARPSVTLLVTPDEAELLKLAMAEGSVSLSLRDPRDAEMTVPGPSTRLADLSPTLAALEARARTRAEIDELRLERERLEALRALEAEASPPWTAEVIKGGSVETRTFEKPSRKGDS